MDADSVRFAGALCAARSLDSLQRAFVSGCPRVLDAPIYGYELLKPRRGVTVGVSDAFVAAYERDARHVDLVLAHAFEQRRAAYNRALMPAGEWEASTAYRRAYRIHGIQHVVAVPLIGAGGILGALRLAEIDRPFAPERIATAEAVAGVLAEAIERIRSEEARERERDRLAAALDVTMTAVVTSAPELRMNAPARRLLSDVADAERHLHQLLARPAADGPFSRRLPVELVAGGQAVLTAASTPVEGGLVAVIDLSRGEPSMAPGALGVLTPRETDVALLVADGLADREIAATLYLSHHTVGQHVKRIYRKLDVDSRVALTRLLLAPRSLGVNGVGGKP